MYADWTYDLVVTPSLHKLLCVLLLRCQEGLNLYLELAFESYPTCSTSCRSTYVTMPPTNTELCFSLQRSYCSYVIFPLRNAT